jgi:formate dehydrogenase subunit gamma
MTSIPLRRWVRATLAAVLVVVSATSFATPESEQQQRRAGEPAPAQAGPQGPRQSHNLAPLWREVRSGDPGFTTIRGPETGVLVQSGGETWRELRNGPITFYGGLILLAVPAAILLFHMVKGQIRLSGPPTGRVIVRFNNWERLVHWLSAISFVMLALTGLTMFLGKYLILPLVGHTVFSWLTAFSKNFHNFLGFLFIASLVLLLITFLRDNVWDPCDAIWIRKLGGLVKREHVPSKRFNFGEKSWFWFGACFLGLTVAGSGLVLVFPNLFETRWAMQTANIVHLIGSVLFIALFLGHAYMGTAGVEGAYQSMITGEVDEIWARDHHELWLQEVSARATGATKGGAK